MRSEDCIELLDAQSELVRALLHGGSGPAGFDALRLQVATAALLSKRRRSLANAWPKLCAALGDRYSERFASYAAITPLPCHGGALADGREFAEFLQQHGDLPDAGRLETVAVDLRFRRFSGGLKARRWPRLSAVYLRGARRLIVGIRIPRCGEWWLNLPFRRRR